VIKIREPENRPAQEELPALKPVVTAPRLQPLGFIERDDSESLHGIDKDLK
jgi:hypothetical protein